eukprot:459693-Prymnesium_polylepis.1
MQWTMSAATYEIVHAGATNSTHLQVNESGVLFMMPSSAIGITKYLQTSKSERWVVAIFLAALSTANRWGPDGRRHREPIVLDIGANAGYYGMFSLAAGARAV